MDYFQFFLFATHLLFVTQLGWYLITNLQWYDYKISRVILKHHKVSWHLIYFVVPFFAYHLTGEFFWIFFYFAVVPGFLLWNKKLDKRLVITWRVKRFLALLLGLAIFGDILCTMKDACTTYAVFLPLFLAGLGSFLIEKFLFVAFKKEAKAKIERMHNMKIVAITGSYGKTSMKNFIVELLSTKYKVYATPGNVNTLGGIIKDINTSLPNDTEIYVVEAGARERGDIYAIAQLVNPHAIVVGKVGPQHIEYFKTLDNIILTKMELMHSNRLERAFIHESVTDEPHDKVSFFGQDISHVESHLDGLSFELMVNKDKYAFETKVLGAFQAINIEAAVLMADYFRVSMDTIVEKVKNLNVVPHRLEKIIAGGKIILDDSYNGNYDGVNEAINLASEYEGRKIIVTPGLVESTEEFNTDIAKRIDEVFDVAIITGSLNAELYDSLIHNAYKIMLKNKSHMEQILANTTQEGDLILFANDAPNFI
ncbi:MAG: UDP-N-acetylmuramoyl-tripeptide--D-alanyl-D-alanine ligase [Thiovulaceae bacterium]|nr:UDP-N-acetylmuramoyl-tripeptide--D-alanyl-D-alanine ligase [Sulfurimonadaceae bacterium]